MAATCSTIDLEAKSSSAARRDTASAPIRASVLTWSSESLGCADLEIDGSRERVGHWRPLFHVADQRIDFAFRNALAFHVDLDPNIGEADRLFTGVAGAPDGRDVEVALELEFELVDGPAAMHGVGVQAHGKTRAKRGERRLMDWAPCRLPISPAVRRLCRAQGFGC